ncbi:hypothetical proteinhypothetical protein [Actinacidiphila reveromycinica]|uniref:Uncharacterized protein n=1 Tax=Actinacidiphila reveromycinica TaxID=659352 RepID=A0A7U3UXY0_9ACTN|nr:hypothetical protein [Streptomyces sp. SN-593]BBB00586.1 hypothetical protein RVR_7719 [Streptomyces sp. SN-593]BBB00639.1 hypothetical proteinhypothetical protein [Streptomyces sp. SN-593]
MAPATVPTRTTPPPVGRSLTVRINEQLHDDLVTLLTPGAELSSIVRCILHDTAEAYRRAHDLGDVPHDTAPDLRIHYRGEQVPTLPMPPGARTAPVLWTP